MDKNVYFNIVKKINASLKVHLMVQESNTLLKFSSSIYQLKMKKIILTSYLTSETSFRVLKFTPIYLN